MPQALITGASSGIGRALAFCLARHGYNLTISARDQEALASLAQHLENAYQVAVTVRPCDLTDRAARRELAAELAAAAPEVLINNAGLGDFAEFAGAEEDRINAMIQVNISALTELTHAVLPTMLERNHGRIMNVASTAAFQPGPLMAVYYATKAYVLSLSEAVAEEISDSRVTITTLCPGPTESGFHSRARMEGSGLLKLMRMPAADEVAEYGYQAMQSGRRVAIHGWRNQMMAQSVRFAPRRWVSWLVRRLSERR